MEGQKEPVSLNYLHKNTLLASIKKAKLNFTALFKYVREHQWEVKKKSYSFLRAFQVLIMEELKPGQPLPKDIMDMCIGITLAQLKGNYKQASKSVQVLDQIMRSVKFDPEELRAQMDPAKDILRFQLLAYILRNEGETHTKVVQEAILNHLLVDHSSSKVSLHFVKVDVLISDYIYPEFFEKSAKKAIIQMVRRSNKNMTIIEGLFECLGFDLTQAQASELLEAFNEQIIARDDAPRAAAQKISEDILRRAPSSSFGHLLEIVRAAVNKTTQDQVRVTWIKIATRAITRRKEVLGSHLCVIFSILLKNIKYMQDTSFIEEIISLVTSLEHNQITNDLKEEHQFILKETVDLLKENPKREIYLTAFAIFRVLSRLVGKEAAQTWQDDLLSSAYKNYLTPFFNAPNKVNASHSQFLCAMHMLLNAISESEAALEKYGEDIENICLLFLNSRNFSPSKLNLENIHSFEVKLMFESLMILAGRKETSSFLEAYQGYRESTQLFLCKMSVRNENDSRMISKLLGECSNDVILHLITGFFWMVQIDVSSLENHKSRSRHVIGCLLSRAEKDEELSKSAEFWKNLLDFSASSFLNSGRYNSTIEWVINRVYKSKNLLQSVRNFAEKNMDMVLSWLVSPNSALFGADPKEKAKLARLNAFFLKLTTLPLFKEASQYLKMSHLTEGEEIDKLTEAGQYEVKELEERKGLYHETLAEMGFVLPKTVSSSNASSAAGGSKGKGKPGPGKSKGGDKGGKIGKSNQMDEEEKQEREEARLNARWTQLLEGVSDLVMNYMKLCPKVKNPSSYETLLSHVVKGQFTLIKRSKNARGIFYTSFQHAINLITSPFMKKYHFFSELFYKMLIKMEIEESDPSKVLEFFESLNNHSVEALTKEEVWVLSKMTFRMSALSSVDLAWRVQSLTFIYKALLSESFGKGLGKKAYKYLSKIINSLGGFSNATELFAKMLFLNDLKCRQQIIHSVLSYYDSGKQIALKSIVGLETVIDLPPEDKINIKILSIDDNEEISGFAKRFWELNKYSMTPEDLKAFDLEKFIISGCPSLDIIERLAVVLGENCNAFSGQASQFIDRSIVVSRKLFELNGAKKPTVSVSEDKLFFFVRFISHVYKLLAPKQIQDVLILTLEKCERSDLPELTEDALQLGRQIINAFGSNHEESLLKIIEGFMNAGAEKNASPRVLPIIFLGILGKFMKNPQKYSSLCFKIISLFKSCPESHQKNLSRFMNDLLIFFPDPRTSLTKLQRDIKEESNQTALQGQCYCFAGLLKGLGIKTMLEIELLEFLNGIAGEKSSRKAGTSVHDKLVVLHILHASIECLGRVFEPFLQTVFPIVLKYQSDPNKDVAYLCGKILSATMNILSAYGVRKILPILLEGCHSTQFRIKLSSIQALGSMAHSASKQVSACLPLIVPKLSEAMGDASQEMREASKRALENIGRTVKNPEISVNCDILIRAISNPWEENKQGLICLLKTEFTHYIDAPSLSIIIPIITFGLRSRDSTLKQMAAQIVGSISALIKDIHDLEPYLQPLIDSLLISLKDVINDVRVITAKALGGLAKKLGLEYSGRFVSVLTKILNDPATTSVERSGGAQGFSEVLSSLGFDFVEKMLPELFALTQEKRNYLRESYLGLFIYLPVLLLGQFQDYIGQTISNTLASISHENVQIKQLALRVVKIIIQNYSTTHESEILDPLIVGLFNENPVTRNSSLILLTDLTKALIVSYSQKGRSFMDEHLNVYAALYIVKFDDDPEVKVTGNNLWKDLVDNTPVVLTKITEFILKDLAFLSNSEVPDVETMFLNCSKNFSHKYFDRLNDAIFKSIASLLASAKEKNNETFTGQLVFGLAKTLREFIMHVDLGIINNRLWQLEHCLFDQIYQEPLTAAVSVVEFYGTLAVRVNKVEIIRSFIPDIISRLKTINSQHPNYEFYISIVKAILELDHMMILYELEKELFDPAFREWQVDLFTRAPDSIAPILYDDNAKLMNKGVKSLLNSALSLGKSENEKDAFCYAVLQLGLSLDDETLSMFVKDILEMICEASKEEEDKILLGLYFLRFLFENKGEDIKEHHKMSFEYTRRFWVSKNEEIKNELSLLIAAIYPALEDDVCFDMISDIRIHIQDFIKAEEKKNNMNPIFPLFDGVDDCLVPFFSMIQKALVTGNEPTCLVALEVTDLLLKVSDQDSQRRIIKDLFGLHLRTLFYSHKSEAKRLILGNMNTMIRAHESSPRDLAIFGPQFSFSLVNLLGTDGENPQTKEILVESFGCLGYIYQNESYLAKGMKRHIASNPAVAGECLKTFLDARAKKWSPAQKQSARKAIQEALGHVLESHPSIVKILE